MNNKLSLTLALAALISLQGADAQRQYAADTITVHQNYGTSRSYTDVSSIDFTKNGFILNSTDGISAYRYQWSDVSRLGFANRFSNGDMLVSNIYYALYLSSEDPTRQYLMANMLAGDDMFGAGGPSDCDAQAIDFLCQSTLGQFDNLWKYHYEGIEDANTAILHLPLTNYPKVHRDHLQGEAFFLRAYYYYELATMFNSVPVYTDNTATDKYQAKAPEVVWGQIFSDLLDAIVSMDRSFEAGRDDKFVTRSAAEALLARAYLFYIGYYQGVHDVAAASATDCNVTLPDGRQLTRNQVVAYLKDCIDFGTNHLLNDYRTLWSYTNIFTVEDYEYTRGQGLSWADDYGLYNKNENYESLFKIKHTGMGSWSTTTGYTNMISLYTGVRCMNNTEDVFPFGIGWGFGTVNPALWDEWSDDDVRKRASIADLSAECRNYVKTDWWQSTGLHSKKYCAITTKALTGSYGYEPYSACMYPEVDGYAGNNMQMAHAAPQNIIRLADVLLMLSELTGDATYMNQVRARAGLSAVQYTLAALQQERRHELAFEGVRWNDMRRWGPDYCIAALETQIGQPISNGGEPTVNTEQCAGYRARYNATGGFWAIPRSARAASDYTLEQNPGWESGDFIYRGWGQSGNYSYDPLTDGTWTYAHNVDEGCWGEVLYRSGTAAGMKQLPYENGVRTHYAARDLPEALPAGRTATGEESQLAYMTFADGRLCKYDQGGTLLGSYAYSYEPGFDGYRRGVLTVEAGAILYPYSAVDGKQPTQFDVVAANEEYLMLVANDGTLHEGDRTTYWSFRHPSWIENGWNRAVRDANRPVTYYDYDLNPSLYHSRYTGGPIGCWGQLQPRTGDDSKDYPVFNYWSPVVQYTVLSADMAQQPALMGVPATGEEQLNAYMLIDMKSMTISKYTATDDLINTGRFTVDLFDASLLSSDNGIIGKLYTDPGTILFPYQYGSQGYIPTEFEIHTHQHAFMNEGYSDFGFVYRPTDDSDHPTYWSLGYRRETDLFTGCQTLNRSKWYWDAASGAQAAAHLEFRDLHVTSVVGPAAIGEGDFRVTHWNPAGNADGTLGTILCPAGAITFDADLYQPTELRILALDAKQLILAFEHQGQTITWTLAPPSLTPEMKLLVSASGTKTWTWNLNGKTVWGNMGNCGGSGEAVEINHEAQWWGVDFTSYDFSDQQQHRGYDGVTGDDQPGSYMVWKDDGTITCYNPEGQSIRTGTFQLQDYDASAEWSKGKLQTSAGAILWPYAINTGGYQPTEFDILYLDETTMCLFYDNGSSLGSWGEATYWHFASNSDCQGIIGGYDDQKPRLWTWDTSSGQTVWGNMGNCGGSGEAVGINHEGQWWGVDFVSCDFSDIQRYRGSDTVTGDDQPGSYMAFWPDGTLHSYAPDGTQVREGSWLYTSAENEWHRGELHTTAGSILWPYAVNQNGYQPESFEVLYLTSDKMCLFYDNGSSLGSWSEATYWHFMAKK